MADAVVALPTLDKLAAFVRKTLCEQDALDPSQTPFLRTPLTRRGHLWGYVFHVEGPRQLKTSAVWVAAAERILFYDSVGRRGFEVTLSEAPDLTPAKARAA